MGIWSGLGAAIAGPVLGAALAKKPKQTSVTKLPDNQQANVDLLMRGAKELYQTGGPRYYEGDTVAPRSADTLAGLDAARAFATGQGGTLADRAITANNAWLDPSILTDLNKIPGYSGMASDIQRRITQNLREDLLPGLRSSGVLSGGYGDTKNVQGQALATARASDNLAGQLSQLGLSTWGQAANLQQNAIQLAPMLMSLGLQPAQILQMIGATNEQDAQNRLNADINRWNFNENRPLLNLEMLKALTGTAGQYGGTNVQTGPSQTGTGAMQGLGAALYLMQMMNPQSVNPMTQPVSLTPTLPTGAFGQPVQTFGLPRSGFNPVAAPTLGGY
ncbi:MAG: hypothetical protein DA330_00870 [Nitrososphaera sp.]|nr:hypothetical protein [Nitrososphaera sp.]